MARPAASKPAFGAGILSGLRATAGKPEGEPLHLRLDQVEEDPDQPRKTFDQGELERLAASIRIVGLLQPIIVRRLEGDRYRIVHGARRLRASRMAEQARIPAFVTAEDNASLAAQVVENQARTGLSNSDLAAAVNRLSAGGMKVKDIAIVCNLRDYQVAAFRSAERLPPFLAERVDQADMRAIYELFLEWEKQEERRPEIEAAMPGREVFLTVTDARRVIAAATGKVTSSVYLDRAKNASPKAPGQTAPDAEGGVPAKGKDGSAPEDVHSASATAGRRSGTPAPPTTVPPPAGVPDVPARPEAASAPTTAAPQTKRLPAFIMKDRKNRQGRLVTDRLGAEEGYAVLLDPDGNKFEVRFSDLKAVGIE